MDRFIHSYVNRLKIRFSIFKSESIQIHAVSELIHELIQFWIDSRLKFKNTGNRTLNKQSFRYDRSWKQGNETKTKLWKIVKRKINDNES